MTAIVRVEHRVGSFDAWKNKFDSDPLDRKKSGVSSYRVSRSLDDASYVTIDLEFPDSNQAKAFETALREMWRSPEAQKLMQNPQVRVVELVENKNL
jgi:hypothetical protein